MQQRDHDVRSAPARPDPLTFELAVHAAGIGVWEWDQRTGVVTWSPELEAIAGVEPGSFAGSFEAYIEAIHPDDRSEVVDAIQDGLATGHHQVEHRLVRPDGSVVWIDGRGAVRYDDDGEPLGLVGVALDVTERMLHRRRLEAELPIATAINRLGVQLNSELDHDRVAGIVVEFVSAVCDAGLVAIVSRPSILHPWEVVVTTGDVAVDPVEIALAEIGALSEWSQGFRADAPAGFDAERIVHHGAGDSLVVPLSIPGSALVELLVVAAPRVAFDRMHEDVIAGVAAHAATALENARLQKAAERQLAERQALLDERDAVARQLQQSLLPLDLPDMAGLDVAATYLPMTEGIGGDFYDVFPLGEGWGLLLGDVCGKGPAAAGVTALARHTVRAAALTGNDPADAMRTLNRAMIDRHGDDRTFCTLAYARVEPTSDGVRLVASVAGHPPILVLRDDGTLEQHGPTGHLVGIFDEIRAGELEIELRPGDLCVLHTDGATDVRRDREEFGDERLADVILSSRSLPAQALVDSIERAVVDFQRGEIDDDLAVIALRVPLGFRAR